MQVPSNIIVGKIRHPAIYICAAMALWGLISALMAVVNNFGGLLACRFFLGFVEVSSIFMRGIVDNCSHLNRPSSFRGHCSTSLCFTPGSNLPSAQLYFTRARNSEMLLVVSLPSESWNWTMREASKVGDG